MIAWLSGTVREREVKSLIVVVGGVGYRVVVPAAVLARTRVGAEIVLYTYHRVGPEAEELYGFAEREQLDYFELLLTVPSVGPRTALSILNAAPPVVLEQAVAEHDTGVLTKVSGVGRKTAERILVELTERIGKRAQAHGPAGVVQQETIEALTSMGYTRAQARAAVRELPAEVASVEEAVRAVLQAQQSVK